MKRQNEMVFLGYISAIDFVRQTHPAATIDGQSTAISQEINIHRSNRRKKSRKFMAYMKKTTRAFHVNKVALYRNDTINISFIFFFLFQT